MHSFLARLRPFADRVVHAVRNPTKRGVLLTLAALPGLLLLYVLLLIPFTPSIGDLRKARQEAPAQVLSADGKELALFKRANRDAVKLADISPNVVKALIATEDHRFYEHNGIDFKRTASAVLRTFGGDRQGGSTITQQLARNMYPDSIGRSVSITRKLKEAITALKIEMVYSKDEILETYLNTVPFLYNAYGIEMAARTYFDKPAHKLDVLEAATLIGMLKGTAYYNPVLQPERAVQRRNTVLGQMLKHEQLSQAQFDTLKKRPLKVDFERQTEPLGPAPHFTQQLRRWLIEWADRNDYNIHADGLVVRTTIDSRLQAAANQAVARQGDRLQAIADAVWGARAGWASNKAMVQSLLREQPEYKAAREAGNSDAEALKKLQADTVWMQALRQEKTRLQAGFLALDPSNGHVLAWVGSRGFGKDQFDHVQQARRQPGSTFKPFVYGTAFEQGISASETFMDDDVEISLGAGGAVWKPSDAGGPSYRPMTLREGLMYSKNTITAQLMQRIGPSAVARQAQAMGLRQSKLEEVLSLALGTSPVTLKEMVAGYATIANGGSYIEPTWVLRIEDRHGKVLEEFKPKTAETAMSAAAAATLLDVMRGVIDQGTGAGIRSRFGIQADVAGKTGTTQDNTDGWFILMHPQVVAGAWVGFNDNRITMQDSWGQGARSALPMVGEFFQAGLRSRVIDGQAKFDAPRGAGLPDPTLAPVTEPQAQPEVVQPEASPPPAPQPPAEYMATGAGPVPASSFPPQPQRAVVATPQVTIVRPGGGQQVERGVRILSVPADQPQGGEQGVRILEPAARTEQPLRSEVPPEPAAALPR
ncbi:transglycosylase domain-containing protein [uncultured Ramlibacter sp.]|uniref:penicillin-binding protein 1A n=1 Tax=uncultured Ramlibacter sp. TaxID=260755 RepID=UPI0026280128|nr:transglycosylase domain-containing protein [uncultured Ramlibacter sp.]